MITKRRIIQLSYVQSYILISRFGYYRTILCKIIEELFDYEFLGKITAHYLQVAAVRALLDVPEHSTYGRCD